MSMTRENIKQAEKLLEQFDRMTEALEILTSSTNKVRYVSLVVGFTDAENDKLSVRVYIPPEDALAYISSQSNKMTAQIKALGVAL